MLLFLSLGALILTVSSAPCPQRNITITGQRWIMPATAVTANSSCVYQFTFPNHQYAVLSYTATDVNPSDVIIAGNEFVKPKANIIGAITTVKDGPSSVIYFQDWKAGTSYTIAPKDGTITSDVSLHLAIAYKNVVLERPNLNNIFVYEGEKNVGTLAHVQFVPLKSHSKVTLFAVNNVNLRGAVFITDEANVRPLFYAYATYVPVYAQDSTAQAGISAELHPALAGAVTIIGDKDGSTPITVRQLSGSAANGTFSYVYGGPVEDHANHTTPLEESDLPKKFTGNMNTFYLTKGSGTIKYTIPSH